MILLAVKIFFHVVGLTLHASIFSKERSVAMAVCVWVAAINVATVVGSVMRKKQLFLASNAINPMV